MKIWIVAAGIVILLIFIAISIYNRLVVLKNRYQNAFAQINVQLKRRYDLIPNLIETAKGYMKHERETLEAVIQARNSAQNIAQQIDKHLSNPAALEQLAKAEQSLGQVLTKFFALSESYPDLKSNQNMMQLSEELTTTENKIAFARQAYNDAVMQYNTALEVFPNNIFSKIFNFKPAQLLQLENPTAAIAPKVQF